MCSHFHIKDAWRRSNHTPIFLFTLLLCSDWLPPQGQHQQRPLLRHAGNQEETHREQEMKTIGSSFGCPPTSPPPSGTPRPRRTWCSAGETAKPPFPPHHHHHHLMVMTSVPLESTSGLFGAHMHACRAWSTRPCVCGCLCVHANVASAAWVRAELTLPQRPGC